MPYPIIGADLIHKFGLIVDLRQDTLTDPDTGLQTSGTLSYTHINSITAIISNSKYTDMLKEYPELLGTPSNLTVAKHSVRHHIETFGPPCAQRVRPLRPERLKQAKAEFELMLERGHIRPFTSAWASPLHMAPKKNGDWRPCGDFRKVNSQTKPNREPVPPLHDFSANLAGKTIFSKIDTRHGYFNVLMAEEDIEKTAVITPFGLFEFIVMPYGLRNAGATFQRLIREVFKGLDFVWAYVDDFLIASNSEEQHMEHLRIVFDLLKKYGTCINIEKCVFGVDTIEFLGYKITPQGSTPLSDRVQALLNYKKPETLVDLRRFLGAINFYRRHLKNAADSQASLNEMLKESKKNDKRPVPWTTESTKAFDKIKKQLAEATLLSHPVASAELRLTTDASSSAMGAVLEQQVDSEWQPLGFFSRKFTSAQRNYSTYDRELTAIFEAIKYFQHWLEGRDFIIRTDHKPLTFAFHRRSDKSLSPRQINQLAFISEFSTNIQYIAELDNSVADALSRIDAIRLPTVIDFNELSRFQATDEELKHFLQDGIYKRHKAFRTSTSTLTSVWRIPQHGPSEWTCKQQNHCSKIRLAINEPGRHSMGEDIHTMSEVKNRTTCPHTNSLLHQPGAEI